jgi:hypothetical protein
MSGEEKRRATLDFGDDLQDQSAPKVDVEAIKAVTRAAGFRETPKAPSSAATAEPAPVEASASVPVSVPAVGAGAKTARRARRKTGRTEQFATRLRADTLDAIYAYADRHEITLAETIERAIAALSQREG